MDKNKIAATIHPFVLGQEIYIYQDGKYIKTVECTLETMCPLINKLCNEYNIDDVHFYGGQLYSLKFKDEFAANKYGKRKIKVHIH